MKKTLTIIGLAVATLAGVQAQTSFTSNSVSTAWNAARWNNSSDAAPYNSAFTANNNVNFTSGNKTWALIALGSAFMLWNLRRKRSIKA
ncbi:MAG: hypothetical protein ACOYNN_06205 [Terrimicrobiaceae bacterium]